MSFTQHVSSEALEDFLEDELPGRTREAVRLHLSYCPFCQEQRDRLSLMRAVDRMWDDYERTDHPAREHVSDEDFKRFWLGELRGAEYLERISGHCIVCRRCQQKRHAVMLCLGVEASRSWQQQVVAGVGLMLWARSRKRSRPLTLAAFLFIGGAALFLATRDRLFPAVGDSPAAPAQVSTQNATASLITSHSSGGGTPAVLPPLTPTSPAAADKTPPAPALIAQSIRRTDPKPTGHQGQRISLRGLSGADEIRGEGSGKQAIYIRIFPSRAGLTRLRIELPDRSTRGVYVVSVQEPVGLNMLVKGKARSPDGKRLTVSLDLKDVPEGEHLLCLIREGAGLGEEEYLGHYPMLLLKTSAPQGGAKSSH